MEYTLILAIVQDIDAGRLNQALAAAGVRCTRLNTVGGFLRERNVAFLIGAPLTEVDRILQMIAETCHTRTVLYAPPFGEPAIFSDVVEVEVGGAVIFVLPVERVVTLQGQMAATRRTLR